MDNNEIIYSLNIEDIQTVAEQELMRELTQDEIDKIRDEIGEGIDWYGTIADVINEHFEPVEDYVID